MGRFSTCWLLTLKFLTLSYFLVFNFKFEINRYPHLLVSKSIATVDAATNTYSQTALFVNL